MGEISYKPLFLKKGKESSLHRFHRWIFSGALKENCQLPEDGDFVEVFDVEKNYLATGYFQSGNIAVRIFSFNRIEINHRFWVDKIKAAFNLRRQLGLTNRKDTTGYRLFFGEGDELPGLIIDIYNKAAIIQAHSIAIFNNRYEIASVLSEVYGNCLETIYYTSSMSFKPDGDEFLKGSQGGTWFKENGLYFYAHWEKGQKTGYFLDQRENRLLLRNYVRNKNVLDAFCYAGGFGANAMAAGARSVHFMDVSAQAIETARQNFERNKLGSNYQLTTHDVLDYIKSTSEKYDVMILDPPAFAKHMSTRHNAVQGYKRLNKLAIDRITKGGILFTFSCSQVVDRKLFENTIRAAAIESGRKMRILHWLSQPPDHPVNIFHPEAEYLKGLVLYVD